jgi:hypothetical protein
MKAVPRAGETKRDGELEVEKGRIFMKKNAILIAGIMFTAAGCATGGQGGMAGYTNGSSTASSQLTENSGNTIRSSEVIDRGAYGQPVAPSQISTAGQYDPGSSQVFQADSSMRGGSNEARGSRDLSAQTENTSGQPINPVVQADSSIRGGSVQARQGVAAERGYVYGSESQPDQSWPNSSINSSSSSAMRADSSIRGGSNEARQYTAPLSRFNSPYPDIEPGYGSPDDLNVGGFGKPGMAQSGSASSTWSEDQLNPYHTAGVLDSSTAGQLSSAAPEPPSQGDLNSSKHLEKDISGHYSLNSKGSVNAQGAAPAAQSSSAQSLAEFKDWREPAKTNDVNNLSDPNSRDSISSSLNSSRTTDIPHNPDSDLVPPTKSGLTGESNEAVGGPASTEVGSSKSDLKPQSQVGVTKDYQSPLFKNNRAQGVGSAATGEFGVANSDHLNAQNSPANNDSRMSDSDLAQKVKEDLVKGSTGTVGVSRTEAKNIKVSAKDGVITLKGSVPSEKDKQMLEIRAMQFRGVNRVKNDLTVYKEEIPASSDTCRGRDLDNLTNSLQH